MLTSFPSIRAAALPEGSADRVASVPAVGESVKRAFGFATDPIGENPDVLALLVLIAIVILLVILGVAVLGLALELLWWALVGFAIGLLARLIVPGAQPIGWLGTIAAGIGGALLGGILADAFDLGGLVQFILAVLVAAALIAAFAGGSRRAYA